MANSKLLGDAVSPTPAAIPPPGEELQGKGAETSRGWARLAEEEQSWRFWTQLVVAHGLSLLPDGVGSGLAGHDSGSLRHLGLSGIRALAGPDAPTVSSISFCSSGEQRLGQEHKGHNLQPFPMQPRPKPKAGVLRAQRAHTVSSLETGYSIRVTPTCKTETTALTKLDPPSVAAVPHRGPLPGRGRVMATGRTGSSFPE